MSFAVKWLLPVLIIVVGIYLQLSGVVDDDIPLPRAGALLVILGIYIESQYVLRIVGDQVYSGAETMIVGPVPEAKNFRERVERGVHHIGLVWVVVGTFIWAFGDLIG